MPGHPVIGILGPTQLLGPAGAINLGGTLPRGFLAVVASEAGRPVSLDRLAALLWGDEAPGGVKVALQQLASRVRRGLESGGLAEALHAEPPGYRLAVDPDLVDLWRFRRLARAAADAERTGAHDEAAHLAGDALALWRGQALVDLADLPAGTLLTPFLDDERWRTEELRATALLAGGRAEDAADHLAAAIAHEPLRERLWILHATALTDANRPMEAVKCARTGMAIIASELGVPPSAELSAIADHLRDHPSSAHAVPRVRAATAQQSLLDGARRRAIDNLERAARAALARRAHGEAVHQWRRALELLGEEDDPDRRLELLVGLGDAFNEGGQEVEARTVFVEAADVARRLGDARGLARAALGYCADHVGWAPPPEQAAMLEEALAAVSPDDHEIKGRLLSRLATEMYWTDSTEHCRKLAEAAFLEAQAADDVEGRLLARYAMAYGNWSPDRVPDLAAVCDAYLEDALVVGDRRHELLARRWLVAAVTELGDVSRGAREADLAMRLAIDLDLSSQQWMTRMIAASHLMIVGDLVRAEQLAGDAFALGAVAEPATALDYFSLFLWTLRWMQGRLDEIASLVEEVSTGAGVDLPRRFGLALTRAVTGRIDEARTILDALTELELDGLPRDASWFVALAALAETAAMTDERRTARYALERLAPYSERIGITSVNAIGPIAHYVGLAAWTVGDHDAGIAALRRAVEIADACGIPAFGARSRTALADRLADTDPDAARQAAKEALAVAQELGLQGTERDARRLLGEG